MKQIDIEDWIQGASVPRGKRRAIARELEAHLEDARSELKLAGWDDQSALGEARRRLGNPDDIVRGFNDVYRRPQRVKVGLAMALATGLLVGVYGGGAAAFSGHVRTHTVHAQQVHPATRRTGPATSR